MPSRPPQTAPEPRPLSTVPESALVPPPASPLAPGAPIDLIADVLPRSSVNLIAGAPGAGKTALVAWLAAQFRDNQPIFGYQPRVVPFQAFISADRSWAESTKRWFDLAGYPDIPAYSLQDDKGFRKSRLRKKQDRMSILRSCLDRFDIPPNSIIWVDPLSVFLGGNLLDYDTCLVACSEIREICQDMQSAVIGTAHASKQKSDKHQRYLRLQDRIAGSVALFGYTDTQMYLAEPAEISEKFYLFHWHPHHSPPASFKLARTKTGLFIPYGSEGRDTGELTAEATQVLDLIPFSPSLVKAKDLITHVEAWPLSRSALYRLLDQLVDQGVILRIGRGQFCRPLSQ